MFSGVRSREKPTRRSLCPTESGFRVSNLPVSTVVLLRGNLYQRGLNVSAPKDRMTFSFSIQSWVCG